MKIIFSFFSNGKIKSLTFDTQNVVTSGFINQSSKIPKAVVWICDDL